MEVISMDGLELETIDMSIKHSDLAEYTSIDVDEFLQHHGTKGQKWGRRRFQNSDGSLTPLGRLHYGVGAARKAVGSVAKKTGETVKSGASKAGNSIRKTIKPTDEELEAKHQKAQERYDRAQLKADTKRLNKEAEYLSGKKKKLKDMNNREIDEYLQRLRRESEIKKLEKEANQSAFGKFVGDYVKTGIGEGVKRGLTNAIDKKFTNMVESKKTEKYSDLLREKESQLKLDVLSGDSDKSSSAAEKLGALRDATSNKKDKKNKDKDSGGKSQPTYSYKNDIFGNASRTATDRAKANPFDKEPPVRATVLNERDFGSSQQSSKSQASSGKKSAGFNPFKKKTTGESGTRSKSASDVFRDVINSNSKTNAKRAMGFSESASKFSKAADDWINNHRNDKL